MQEITAFDFIVVGAGSAGCVLADRLSENGKNKILVVEFGGKDNSALIQMPAALASPMNDPKYDWGFWTEPEPGLNGRQIHHARGKVIGGSSSINGMVYVRGHSEDFNEWETLGAKGWGYSNCLPYFKRAENSIYGADDYRGADGPIGICNGNNMENPLYKAFIDAGIEAGYMKTHDYNGFQQEGFSRMDMTVKNGIRSSTSNAYLKPALKRSNLLLETHALIQRLLFNGRQCIGVEYRKNDTNHIVRARREVILCAGAFGSPHIMMLSGVGSPLELQKLGIEVIHELPGVGKNLQDHLEIWMQHACIQPISLAGVLNPLSKLLIGIKWMLFKKGLGATNHFESCGFIKSQPSVRYPDIQYHFLPVAMSYNGLTRVQQHGYQVHVGHNKPKSRGKVSLRSNDPREKPELCFNYLDHEDDRRGFRACVRLSRDIFSQRSFDPYRGPELAPGDGIQTDEEIDQWVAQNAETAYHPASTCKMGVDKLAVVDPECRVHGVSGLRVVDSSIMPTVTNGNLNAPTIMIGEKAADIILGVEPLAPSTAQTFEALHQA